MKTLLLPISLLALLALAPGRVAAQTIGVTATIVGEARLGADPRLSIGPAGPVVTVSAVPAAGSPEFITRLSLPPELTRLNQPRSARSIEPAAARRGERAEAAPRKQQPEGRPEPVRIITVTWTVVPQA